MERRVAWIGLALVCACGLTTGCLNGRDDLRKDSASDTTSGETNSGEEVKSDAPKGFFRSSRLSGGWSSEAREIERSLGVK